MDSSFIITYITKLQYKSHHQIVKYHLEYETLPSFSISQNAVELNNAKEGTVTNTMKTSISHERVGRFIQGKDIGRPM